MKLQVHSGLPNSGNDDIRYLMTFSVDTLEQGNRKENSETSPFMLLKSIDYLLNLQWWSTFRSRKYMFCFPGREQCEKYIYKGLVRY